MPKCPNCGQTTARTEDWACQWCGYPLLSNSYPKISKTYRQLKEEGLPKKEPLMREEIEASLLPGHGALPQMHALEPEPKPKPEPEPEPEPEIEVTVAELLSAYATEGVAADARFVGKIVKVTGLVDRIEVKDALEIYYITLTGAEANLLQNIKCVFDRKHGPDLNQLMTGQTVTVQGKYDGSIMDIRMSDCVLVQ